MKSNKLLLSALALALTLATPVVVAPLQTSAGETTKGFKDVPKTSPYYGIINEMAEKGIIGGYEDGTFRPDEPITRKHASALLDRQLKLPEVAREFKIKDMPKAHPYYDDMYKVVNKGYLKINPNGLIFPDRPLTRGEMAQVLARAYELDLNGDMHPFSGVREWNNMYVSALYNSGITTGYTDGTFREDETVTRGHFAVFMYRTMKHVEPVDIDTLTDEELNAMSNRQLANYIIPYQYHLHMYRPSDQTNDSQNYNEHYQDYWDFTRGFDSYDIEGIEYMSKYGLQKQRVPSVGAMLEDLSKNVFGLSAKETIDVLNRVFLNGDYVTSQDIPTSKKDFAMFYNYGAGNLFIEINKTKTK